MGRLGKTVGWECESWVLKQRETEAAEKLDSNDRKEITILSLSLNSVLLMISWNEKLPKLLPHADSGRKMLSSIVRIQP